jgi:pyruvate carboxylase subunit B
VKFFVRIAGQPYQVDVFGDEVSVSGRPVSARLLRVPGTPLYQLLSERAARTYAMVRRTDGWVVQRGGEVWLAEAVDERTRQVNSLKRAPQDAGVGAVIRAPMPGLVVRVEVQVGQQVPAGGGLVVLEAMKMENEIRSPGAGKVKAVLVEAGQAVEKNAPLIELAAEG